jgi:cytochrome b pre-mRNA-processing protein 3
MALRNLLRRSGAGEGAGLLYAAAVAQARQPGFFLHCGVPDTVDGRFDMISLHVHVVLRRLRQGGETAAETAQAVFDAMFADMDRSLREMGVGDLGVGRRVKAMARAFYGRVAAYDAGLDGGAGALEDALKRNVFRAAEPVPGAPAILAAYMRRAARGLANQPLDALLAGRVAFGPAPAAGDIVSGGEEP